MTELLKKLHIYSGVVFGWALLLFGVVGIFATFAGDPAKAEMTAAPARQVDFKADAGATDAQVAQAVYNFLKPPHAASVPDYAVGRNAQGELRLDFYGPNGRMRVFVDEKNDRLDIVEERNDTGHFLVNMHASLPIHAPRTFAVMLWSIYMELSIFALIGFVLSGVYLWFASRPKLRWAQMAFGVGTAASIAFMVWVA